jgi:hypothetical protein
MLKLAKSIEKLLKQGNSPHEIMGAVWTACDMHYDPELPLQPNSITQQELSIITKCMDDLEK